MPALIQPFFHGASHTWTYVVADPLHKRAAVIDPVLDFDAPSGRTASTTIAEVEAWLQQQGLVLDWILETHAHADHLSAGHWLKQRHRSAQIGIGVGICAVQEHFRPLFNLGTMAVDGSPFDRLWSDADRFQIGAIEAQVISTPGHTNDSVSYLIEDAVFVGDTLLMPDSGTARCDFPGGDAGKLYASIQRLYALAEATRVFVCHDYGPNGRPVAGETSVADQRQNNTQLSDGVSAADFMARRRARDATLDVPTLLLPAIQVNINAGALPAPEANGIRYLKLPLDAW